MQPFSHPCMHMAALAYANDMLKGLGQILTRKFKFDYVCKTMQLFLKCFKEMIFRLKS